MKNRMLFYFLDMVGAENLSDVALLYKKEQFSYYRSLDAITETSFRLRMENIKHAVIKTVRPYKSTTVDIDIIIFGPKSEYEKAILVLLKANYGMLGRGPQSTTLQHPTVDIKVDIYNEIAVSNIIYLDKQKLADFKIIRKLPNGRTVEMLAPEADLVVLIAHSIIKEHMYTLSEYYTYINYLKQINKEKFLQLAFQSNVTIPIKTHTTITALLHKKAFGKVPKTLENILDALGEDTLEAASVCKKDLEMPHKYHPLTVLRSLMEIAKEKKSRDSMALQVLRMLRPSFTKEFTKQLIQHIKRETY
jgi:hypothetical protein